MKIPFDESLGEPPEEFLRARKRESLSIAEKERAFYLCQSNETRALIRDADFSLLCAVPLRIRVNPLTEVARDSLAWIVCRRSLRLRYKRAFRLANQRFFFLA